MVPKLLHFSKVVAPFSRSLSGIHFLMYFGRLLVPFDSLLGSFGSLLVPFGSLLAPFECQTSSKILFLFDLVSPFADVRNHFCKKVNVRTLSARTRR